MTYRLTHNAYGKSAVRLTKIVRNGSHHTLFEIDARVQLEGDFTAAYTDGDNRQVVATDTIKNTVYVVAKENAFDSIEQFATILCRHFVKTYAQVSAVKVELEQTNWVRIDIDGRPHDHAFTGGGTQKRFWVATLERANPRPDLRGGVRGLLVLKTTESGWENFHTDRYRTLKDTADRILASQVDATWTYGVPDPDGDAAYDTVTKAILHAFTASYSRGAQQTIMDMGTAVLAACADVASIAFELPNLHRIPFNFDPFGLEFDNDIYVATAEPYGLIHGTITRSEEGHE